MNFTLVTAPQFAESFSARPAVAPVVAEPSGAELRRPTSQRLMQDTSLARAVERVLAWHQRKR